MPATSLLTRLECASELVSERSEPLRRRGVLAFGVLAHFFILQRVGDGLAAETNAAARRIDPEDDDLDVGPDGKRFRNVCFPGQAGLAQRDEPCAPRGE